MKTPVIRLIGLILAALPLTGAAQENIKSAFDAIIKCPEAKITENHYLEKDPDDGTKTGAYDVFDFVIPADKFNLIENVVSAFDEDADMAYSISRGDIPENGRNIGLYAGDTLDDSYTFAYPGFKYIYSLFLAPSSEDSEGIYRYAYGMSYKEEAGKYCGRLITTYSTTLKYRQQKLEQEQYNKWQGLTNSTEDNNASQSWFDMLMLYFQGMLSPAANSQTMIGLASKAYKVICDTSKYPEVTDAEKNAIRKILKSMIADKD